MESAPADTSRLPSAENLTAFTHELWPRRTARGVFSEVPETHGPIGAAGRKQPAIRRKDHAEHASAMTDQMEKARARCDVPDLNGRLAGDGQPSPVGRERDVVQVLFLSDRSCLTTCRGRYVPHINDTVPACDRRQPSIGRVGDSRRVLDLP